MKYLSLAALLIVAALPSQAQVLYGSIVGTVEDPSGASIPGAAITLTNTQTAATRDAKADEQGRYTLVSLIPGNYNLVVTAAGFRSLTRTGITITINSVTRFDSRLEVGQISEKVTVEASAAALQTDRSDTRTEINARTVVELPLPAYRNFQSLINLVPGATPAAFQNSVGASPQRSLTTNINGTNRNNNSTRIDGAMSVNLWLPQHAGYVVPEEMVDTVNITTSAAAITVVTQYFDEARIPLKTRLALEELLAP